MAFSLDHSLTHIEIKEPDLAEIYRSTNSVVPPQEECQGHMCEAYVCSAREKDRFCIYVAFFDTTTQSPVILSTTCEVLKPADQKRLVNEALKLTKSMGFAMEPVKLAYSAAMRQVIIQGINVMRPPHRVKKPSSTVAPPVEAPLPLPGDATADDHAAAKGPAPSLPKITTPQVAELSAEVADLRKALTDMVSAKAETEKIAERTIMAIKLELESTIAWYREREEPPQEVSVVRQREQPLEDETSAGPHAEPRSRDEALQALEEMLLKETANRREAETKAEALGLRLERAEEESATLRLELDRLSQEMAAGRLQVEEQLAVEVARQTVEGRAATEQEQLLRDELAAARHESSALHGTLKNVLKEQQVLVNEREALRAELAVFRESAGIGQQEPDARVREQEGFKECLKRLEHEQMETRQRYETLLAEKELKLKEVCTELKSLSAKQEHLLGEKKQWDTIADSFKKKAHKAVERLKLEKQALEEKLKQMEESGPRPLSIYGRTSAETAVVSPFAAQGLTDTGSGFSRFGNPGPATDSGSTIIRYSPQVSVISYQSTQDIVDLYGSANVIRARPEGRRSQDCSAYVCVIEREGKTAIHLAWHLIDSKEVLICLPEKQPEGRESYARVLQDAIFYFESIGFMMDRLELPPDSCRQLKLLEKIGICKMDVSCT